jgi:ribosome recycling factor
MGDLRSLKDDGDVGEDEERRSEEQLQKVTDQAIGDIDDLMKAKEQEILTV